MCGVSLSKSHPLLQHHEIHKKLHMKSKKYGRGLTNAN